MTAWMSDIKVKLFSHSGCGTSFQDQLPNSPPATLPLDKPKERQFAMIGWSSAHETSDDCVSACQRRTVMLVLFCFLNFYCSVNLQHKCFEQTILRSLCFVRLSARLNLSDIAILHTPNTVHCNIHNILYRSTKKAFEEVRLFYGMPQLSVIAVWMQVLKPVMFLLSKLVSVLSCISDAMTQMCCQWILQSGSSRSEGGECIHAHTDVIKISCPFTTLCQCSWQSLLFQQREDRRRQVQLVSQVSRFLSSGQRFGVHFTVLDSFCYCLSYNLGSDVILIA